MAKFNDLFDRKIWLDGFEHTISADIFNLTETKSGFSFFSPVGIIAIGLVFYLLNAGAGDTCLLSELTAGECEEALSLTLTTYIYFGILYAALSIARRIVLRSTGALSGGSGGGGGATSENGFVGEFVERSFSIFVLTSVVFFALVRGVGLQDQVDRAIANANTSTIVSVLIASVLTVLAVGVLSVSTRGRPPLERLDAAAFLVSYVVVAGLGILIVFDFGIS